MASAQILATQVDNERRIQFIGTANVSLESLQFPSKSSRSVDPRNVSRLQNLFLTEGCYRQNLHHHIAAEISASQLAEVLSASNVSEAILSEGNGTDTYPHLEFSTGKKLDCLNGQHRILAASSVLTPPDRYWPVDLYRAELSNDLRLCLIEEYRTEQRPDDGEFYSKIREYQGFQGLPNPYFEKRWWARLSAVSSTRANNLRQIILNRQHIDFREAFDLQLRIPGLSGGMRLSTTHKMFALKCHEEVLHYLRYIQDFWSRILGHDERWMGRVDRTTVQALELKAPGAIIADRETLEVDVKSGQLLSAFTRQERDVIWLRILAETTTHLIPSLYSFFEDLNYLQGPADSMRSLVGLPGSISSISTALASAFSVDSVLNGKLRVQCSELVYSDVSSTVQDQVDGGILQLWMYAFRHYLEIPPETRKRPSRLAKPTMKRNTSVLFHFAELAQRLGFMTDQIKQIVESCPDRTIAKNALLEARSPELFHYQTATFENFVNQIVGFFSTAQPKESEKNTSTDECENLSRRCGIPEARCQKMIKRFLFLPNLRLNHQSSRSHADTRFVCFSTFTFFFGKTYTQQVQKFLEHPLQMSGQECNVQIEDIDAVHDDIECVDAVCKAELTRLRRIEQDQAQKIESLTQEHELLRSQHQQRCTDLERIQREKMALVDQHLSCPSPAKVQELEKVFGIHEKCPQGLEVDVLREAQRLHDAGLKVDQLLKNSKELSSLREVQMKSQNQITQQDQEIARLTLALQRKESEMQKLVEIHSKCLEVSARKDSAILKADSKVAELETQLLKALADNLQKQKGSETNQHALEEKLNALQKTHASCPGVQQALEQKLDALQNTHESCPGVQHKLKEELEALKTTHASCIDATRQAEAEAQHAALRGELEALRTTHASCIDAARQAKAEAQHVALRGELEALQRTHASCPNALTLQKLQSDYSRKRPRLEDEQVDEEFERPPSPESEHATREILISTEYVETAKPLPFAERKALRPRENPKRLHQQSTNAGVEDGAMVKIPTRSEVLSIPHKRPANVEVLVMLKDTTHEPPKENHYNITTDLRDSNKILASHLHDKWRELSKGGSKTTFMIALRNITPSQFPKAIEEMSKMQEFVVKITVSPSRRHMRRRLLTDG